MATGSTISSAGTVPIRRVAQAHDLPEGVLLHALPANYAHHMDESILLVGVRESELREEWFIL